MQDLFDFIKALYPYDVVPLHEPVFIGNEKKYLENCVDTTFVSSVGEYVTKFEQMMCDITGAKHAVAVVNGTCGLQIALECSGLVRGQEVVTQSLTFVGTVNAISHAGGIPVFVDVERETMGMCPDALEKWLSENTKQANDKCVNKTTGNIVHAIMPVHIFGNPCLMDELCAVAKKYNVLVVEDSAESLGSARDNKHTGTFGHAGVFSFNGNKIVTAGGGGCIVTDNEDLAKRMKHITTTAKQPHPYGFFHDEIAYNYRLTNLAAAMACAQLENLNKFINVKKQVFEKYSEFNFNESVEVVGEPKNTNRNNWLNAIMVKDKSQRDKILNAAIAQNIHLRPIWTLMSDLPMYKDCQKGDLTNSIDFANRVINLPSSANAKV